MVAFEGGQLAAEDLQATVRAPPGAARTAASSSRFAKSPLLRFQPPGEIGLSLFSLSTPGDGNGAVLDGQNMNDLGTPNVADDALIANAITPEATAFMA